MFGRRPIQVEVNAPVEYITRDVHHHRAPTDESVRLLKEMEQAARDKIIDAIRLEGNGFNCVVHVMLDAMSDQRITRAVFMINGHREEVEVRTPMLDSEPKKIAEELRDAIARKIATIMLGDKVLSPLWADARFSASGGSG